MPGASPVVISLHQPPSRTFTAAWQSRHRCRSFLQTETCCGISPFRSWRRCRLRARRGLRSVWPGRTPPDYPPTSSRSAASRSRRCPRRLARRAAQVRPEPSGRGGPDHRLGRGAPTPPPPAALVRQLEDAVTRAPRSPAPAPARSCWPRPACWTAAGHHPLAVRGAARQPLPSADGGGRSALHRRRGDLTSGRSRRYRPVLHLMRREHGAEINQPASPLHGCPAAPRRRTSQYIEMPVLEPDTSTN